MAPRQLLLKPITRLIQQLLEKAGWVLYRRPVRVNGMWQHLHDLFAQEGIDCVLDVGGHHGEYATELRTHGYTGRIISFEPCPESFEALSKRCAGDPLWSCHQVALGDHRGELPFHVTRDTRFSSFRQPNSSGLEWSDQGCAIERTESVAVRRLDEMLPTLGLPDSTRYYLKIDTQGAEPDVIRGAHGVLSSIFALQAEVPVRPIYEGVVSYSDFIEEMTRAGYGLTGLYPTASEDDMRIVEFDCVLLRDAQSAATHLPFPSASE